jgi:hypothetical protein
MSNVLGNLNMNEVTIPTIKSLNWRRALRSMYGGIVKKSKIKIGPIKVRGFYRFCVKHLKMSMFYQILAESDLLLWLP